MLTPRRTLGGLFVLLTLASCSLTTDLSGLSGGAAPADTEAGPDAATTADTSPTDAASTTDGSENQDATIVDGCSESGCFDMPPGFSLVAFGATAKGSACPAGYGSAQDTVAGPTVGSNACTCDCTVTGQPSCPTSGTIVAAFGTAGAGTCPSNGGTMTAACGTDGFLGPFATGNEHTYTPPGKTGGTCNASATKDTSKLTYAAEGRVCQATTLPVCNTKVCPAPLSGAFGACIRSSGDVACPSTFPNKHLLGTGATFTCGSGCTCNVTATCKGKLNFYASADCSGAIGFTFNANATCVQTDAAGASYGSHDYVPDPPANVACAKTGSSAPSAAALSDSKTVCCK